jgi:3-hydroxyanthranilate 3,4-dioxygenase
MGLESFNLMQWIEDNRAQLTPPMVNKPIWRDRDFVVMILAGPILRADYHDDPYDEFFFQLKGNMVLRTIQDGKHKDIAINEGGVFLAPAHMPHAPHRPEPGSIGLVVERPRPAGVLDAFEWYCPDCATRVHRCEFHIDDMPTERPRQFAAYYDHIAKGSCPNCGAANPKDPND